mgnify:FL=1
MGACWPEKTWCVGWTGAFHWRRLKGGPACSRCRGFFHSRLWLATDMSKKRSSAKDKKAPEALREDESRELEIILDRLRVQNPTGESLPNYLASLRAALSSRESLASALIEKLGGGPSAVGFQVLLALRDLFPGGAYKRLVKQALYRFSQKGYAEEPQAGAEREVVLVQKEERKAVAHLVPGAPNVFGLVLALLPEDRILGSNAVSSFIAGGLALTDVAVVEGSPRNYKEMLREAMAFLPGSRPSEIPVGHAARLFFDSCAFNARSPITGEVEAAKMLFRPYYDPDARPYVYELMPPEPESVSLETGEVYAREVFAAAPMQGAFLDKEEIFPYFKRILNVEHSTLVVSQAIMKDRIRGLLAEAVDRLCDEDMKRVYVRFFEELTMQFKLAGKDELARRSWIVTGSLREAARPSESAVMLEVAAGSMAYYWPDAIDRAVGRPEAQQPEPFERLESGLIIPK